MQFSSISSLNLTNSSLNKSKKGTIMRNTTPSQASKQAKLSIIINALRSTNDQHEGVYKDTVNIHIISDKGIYRTALSSVENTFKFDYKDNRFDDNYRLVKDICNTVIGADGFCDKERAAVAIDIQNKFASHARFLYEHDEESDGYISTEE